MRYLLQAVVFSLLVWMTPACFAQAGASTGEISGTVTDPAGAAIAGVTVAATNTGTGFKQSVKTSETGVYRLTLLPLGTYEVEAQSAGFTTSKHTGVELNAGAVRTVDIALTLAGAATTVE